MSSTKKQLNEDPVVKLLAGTTRTLLATWSKTNYKNQDGYRAMWVYDVGQGDWIAGQDSTTSICQSTYVVPDNKAIVSVKVSVAPEPGSKAKWKGKYRYTIYTDGFPEADEDQRDPEDTTPSAPGNVSINIEGTSSSATVTATVANYNDKFSTGVVRIEIVENDSTVVQAGDVAMSMGVAKLTWSGTNLAGKKYKARAMAYGNSGTDSPWSNYTDNQTVPENPVPSAPSNVDLEADVTSVTVKVTNYSDELSDGRIRIQIVEDDANVVYDGVTTNSYGLATVTWTGGDLRGKRYKARAMAFSQNGEESSWSAYTSNSYVPESTTPAPPDNVSIAIDGKTVTASVTNYSDTFSNGKLRIQIVENDSTVVHEGDVTISYGLASVAWTRPNFTGRRYKARAMAYGLHGEKSLWSEFTQSQYAAPGGTTGLKVASTSSTSVTARWDVTPGADSYTIEYTATTVDGRPVFDTASAEVQTVSGITATYYPATGLATGQRWYFRVRGVNNGGNGDWSNIANIMLGTTPDIPSVWSYTTVAKIGTPVVLNWVHSSQDDSEQSGARIGIKINNGAETVITLTTQTSYSYNTSNLHDGDKVQWRVSTKGITGIPVEWGGYSEYREFVVYSPPSVTFTVGHPDPIETYPVVQAFPLQIYGTASPNTQTPVAFYISITAESQYDISENDGIEIHVNAGQEVYSKFIATSSRTLNHVLYPGDIYLERGVSYRVKVTVAMTNGLTAEATRLFTAKWDPVNWYPDGEVTVDKHTYVAYIRPFCSDEYGLDVLGGFRLAVYRIGYDGQLTEIAANINPNDNITVTDLHPSLDYARYRIVATDMSTGVVYYTDLEGIPVNAKCAVLQWEGEARNITIETDLVDYLINDWCGTILKLPYNLDVADDISPDVELVSYIGRKHPVSYYGTQQGSTSRWSAEIPKRDVESIAKLRALAIYPGDVYVREPSGSSYWANVKVSYNIGHNKPTISVDLTIARVEGGA